MTLSLYFFLADQCYLSVKIMMGEGCPEACNRGPNGSNRIFTIYLTQTDVDKTKNGREGILDRMKVIRTKFGYMCVSIFSITFFSF
jgi:hypothetical protein